MRIVPGALVSYGLLLGTASAQQYLLPPVYNGVLTAPTLSAGAMSTINLSGSQGGFGSNQYQFISNGNLAGSISSGVVNANQMVINDDTVRAPGSAVTWLNVFGNIGVSSWRASTAYGLNAQANNGGRIYQATTAGTSASSGGPTGTGSSITDGTVVWSFVSPDFSGNRAGIQATIGIGGANDPATPNDASRIWQAMLGTTSISANQGGTGFNGNSAGFVLAGGDQMFAFSGATYLSGVIGRETDVGIQTGASAVQRTGIQVISFNENQGYYEDDAFRIGSVNGVGFQYGLGISGGANYPISSTGTLIGYLAGNPGSVAGGGQTYANPISALGIDLTGLEQTTAAWRTNGGTFVTGAGAESIQSLKISTNGVVVSIDAVGFELQSVAVASGGAGSGYKSTDHLYDPQSGTILGVTVNGSGDVMGFSIVTRGHYTYAQPTNPVTLYGGTGYGAQATMNWIEATTLALSPTGGMVTVTGDLLANSQSTLATSATSGFLHLPHTTAAPTGTPTNTTPGCEWNTGTHVLNCYDGSSWYHFTGTSGAG